MAAIGPSVVTVIGTLGGTTLGIGGTLLVEHVRRRHEDATRWHDERRRAYSVFFTEVIDWSKKIQEMNAESLDGVVAAENRVYDQLGALELLSTPPVYLAVADLMTATEEAELAHASYLDDQTAENQEKYRAASDLLPRARLAFSDAVRSELGITPLLPRGE